MNISDGCGSGGTYLPSHHSLSAIDIGGSFFWSGMSRQSMEREELCYPRRYPVDRLDRFPVENGKTLERVKGIEPSYSAWKAAALPLSYTRARPLNYHTSEAASTAMQLVWRLKRPLFRRRASCGHSP